MVVTVKANGQSYDELYHNRCTSCGRLRSPGQDDAKRHCDIITDDVDRRAVRAVLRWLLANNGVGQEPNRMRLVLLPPLAGGDPRWGTGIRLRAN